jgi:hypothetical protein
MDAHGFNPERTIPERSVQQMNDPWAPVLWPIATFFPCKIHISYYSYNSISV